MNNIKIQNNKGLEEEYEIIFDYTTKQNHTHYIVYTDFARDENNIIKCYSSIIDETGRLSKITDEEQINFIESTLQSLADMSHLKYQIQLDE